MWKLLRSDISKNVRSQILKKRPWEKSVVPSCLTCQILVKTRDAGSYTHTASPTRPHNSRSVLNHTYGMYGPNSDTRTTQKGSLTEIWPGQILSDRCQTIKIHFFSQKHRLRKTPTVTFWDFWRSQSRDTYLAPRIDPICQQRRVFEKYGPKHGPWNTQIWRFCNDRRPRREKEPTPFNDRYGGDCYLGVLWRKMTLHQWYEYATHKPWTFARILLVPREGGLTVCLTEKILETDCVI